MAVATAKKTVNLEINGIQIKVPEGTSILDAARKAGVKIPTLCYHPDLPPSASCGLCIVKVEGLNKMVRSCATKVQEGMKVITHDPEIVEIRRTVLELILSNHPNDCLKCGRNGTCELQQLTADFGIREEPFEKILRDWPKDESTPSLVFNPVKCVLCGRCVEVCQEMQNVWVLEFLDRGFEMRIAPAAGAALNDSPCVKCGQCSAHCPVGAIFEKDDTQKVWDAIRDPDKFVVVQMAPAVRVAFGEAFGLEPGTITTGQMYALFRRMGFDAVFDTNFGADLTIMEEATEFKERLLNNAGPLPLITTCCPSWVDYMEKYYPDMIPHFSSAKSPHEMLGVMAKTYYAKKAGIDPAKMVVVSVMPCTSKKYEITRAEEMFASGYQDVDVSITTRELARMTKEAGIDFVALPEEEADSILGEYTGAGVIFGATGGVMEAALRSAYHFITGEELKDVDFVDVRGLEGVREAEVEIDGRKIRVAVAHGLANVQYVLEKVRKAKEKGEEPPYHFIEVMACKGGCIGGGGQPYFKEPDVRKKRAEGLYEEDREKEIRCSHQNPYIKQLYTEFLGHPLSEKAHKLLHTTYHPRPLYVK